MKATKVLMSLLLISTMFSCSSVTTVKINSTPNGAKIFVKNMMSQSSEEIGVTPLIINSETLEQKKLKDGPLHISLLKDGYEERTILLTETEAVDIDFSLSLKPKDKITEAKSYDKVSSQLFEVQRLIRSKSYKEALVLTSEIKKTFPELSVPHELEGSIYYLQKDYKRSLSAFNASYLRNSENLFVLKMKKIIMEKQKMSKR